MGPYCKFCDRRCFVPFPAGTPKHILDAYGSNDIIATCQGGQQFEKERIGYCYQDILDEIKKAQEKAQSGHYFLDRLSGVCALAAAQATTEEGFRSILDEQFFCPVAEEFALASGNIDPSWEYLYQAACRDQISGDLKAIGAIINLVDIWLEDNIPIRWSSGKYIASSAFVRRIAYSLGMSLLDDALFLQAGQLVDQVREQSNITAISVVDQVLGVIGRSANEFDRSLVTKAILAVQPLLPAG